MADAATIEIPATTTPAATAAPADWRTFLTDDLKADPVVSRWSEKASEKDVPGLIKGYANLFTQQGNKIAIPGKDAKPEEMTALKAKLVEAGVLPKPIADPKEYGIAKPDHLPAGAQWSDELSGKLAGVLHKYQVPKEMAAELLALHTESMGGTMQRFKVDQEAAMATLKAEHGEQYDARSEMTKRMMKGILKTPEELAILEHSGLADHPAFLSVLMRLAPLAMQDSSFLQGIPEAGGEITGDAAREEYAKVMSDPKHEHYEGFKRGDKKAQEYVNGLYSKAYGNAQVVI